MGKGSRGKGRRGGGGLGAKTDIITRQRGKVLWSPTTSSNTVVTRLSMAINARLLELADLFGLYRFTKLRFSLQPEHTATFGASQPATSPFALGFTPDYDGVTGLPATIEEVMEYPFSAYMPSMMRHAVVLDVPRSELVSRSQLKWFECSPAQTELEFEAQGEIFIFSLETTTTLAIVVEYEVELTNPLPPAVTLERLSLRIARGAITHPFPSPRPTYGAVEGWGTRGRVQKLSDLRGVGLEKPPVIDCPATNSQVRESPPLRIGNDAPQGAVPSGANTDDNGVEYPRGSRDEAYQRCTRKSVRFSQPPGTGGGSVSKSPLALGFPPNRGNTG